MIDRDYVLTMARYNAWQNAGMKKAMESLTEAALRKDRGAFFGSILATANHLLWGDRLWMSRFDGREGPSVGPDQHTELTPTLATWGTERFRTDGRILTWAEKLRSIDLTGDLTWHSGVLGREVTKPKALCVTQLFNHQTHHRGQIHAMLTAAGAMTQDTDLFLMPETGPWL
ncbi:DinB family protein [Pseudaestuariivita atlantica]|uniref:Damage-inducible protein DinB n=1 Tax=Pseudaestuariivita atlantica TaxID=1317121 RepID=A0A0L1JUV0_9RHOB|nr:DinB family protein [Pseudaestuariivita atlantica]KNG95452.1 damage-inducible protein DinB [Pseudaestuariivita atlantica]